MFIIQSKAEALCLLWASETSLHLSKHSQACSPLPTSKGNAPVCLLCVLPKPNWSWGKLQYLPCFYKGNYKSEDFFFCKVSYWNHSNLCVNSLLQVELEQRIHVHIVTHVLKVDWQESLYLIALIYISEFIKWNFKVVFLLLPIHILCWFLKIGTP